MRTIIIHLIILLCFFVSCKEQEQQVRTPKQYTIEQLYNNLSVSAAGFNTDETSVLVDNNHTGIFNVYELNITDTAMHSLTASQKESFFPVPANSFIVQMWAVMKMIIYT